MTGVDAIKQAVLEWHYSTEYDLPHRYVPEYVKKLCHVIYKLRKEVFNMTNGNWEYEGV